MSATATQSELVLVETSGRLGRIRLNRPKALNSLTLAMIRAIAGALDRFEADERIAAVLLTGEGGRGLCAGGDIRAIGGIGRAEPAVALQFFREEYRLNARIAAFPKPYIAVMDGITMGGGVGLSAHGSHRIVTETTRLAMPETGIGFFPDIGATWLLAHAPGEVGTYLGLTGGQIGAADSIYAGLADVFVPGSRLAELETALAAAATPEEVTRCIGAVSASPDGASFSAHRAELDEFFDHDDVPSIIASLERAGTEFARATRETILSRSPTSLKLTLRLLRAARRSTGLAACLEREFAACHCIIAGHDFYEGVRAAVIDKDRNPRWSPTTLEAVSEGDIDRYFIPAVEPLFPGEAKA